MALRIEQTPEHPLYLFALTANELAQIADVCRVGRRADGALIGYQRAAVKRHIRNIKEYLDRGPALFPNSLILALSGTAVFTPNRRRRILKNLSKTVVSGTLEIPVPRNGGPKPAWIVDGQQRAVALWGSPRGDWPVPVNGFVAEDVEIQREQFLRVNSTKPLPRGLVTELLPEVRVPLRTDWTTRRIASAACDFLNRDERSPFLGLIRRTSLSEAGRRHAVVADTAIIRMIEDSLSSTLGCLFIYRNLATGEVDVDSLRRVLLVFWRAVRDEFPEAWGLPPSRSRLMHSVGIRAMGRLMDRVIASVEVDRRDAHAAVRRELQRVKGICRWTAGVWEGLHGLRWNEVQNVPSHIRGLSHVLVRTYLEAQGQA